MLRTVLQRQPLRRLLAVCLAVCPLLAVCTLGALVYLQVSSSLWQAGELRLRAQAEAAVARLAGEQPPSPSTTRGVPLRAPLLVPERFEQAAPDLAAELQSRDVAVWVLDADGHVIARGATQPQAPSVQTRLGELTAVRGAERSMRAASFAVSGERATWQVVVVPLVRAADADVTPAQGTLAGAIVLATPYTAADELLAALRTWLLLGALSVLAFGSALGWLLARALAAPLERMAATAGRVAAGDLSERVGLPAGRNEVYATAAAFDLMVERLQTTLAAQRRFIADASHEMKTPLTAVGGMAELLRLGADQGDPVARERMLASLEHEIDRLGRLVHDLLALSRLDEGAAPVRAPLNLSNLLRGAIARAQQAHPDRQFDLVLDGSPTMAGDANLLERAVLNLLDNAARYSASGTTIRVEAKLAAGEVVMTVCDRGSGIAAVDLPHVFERFYRADASRARQTGGSGLGLSIVRATAAAHGGSAEISSDAERGTTVTLRLPAAAQPSGSDQETPPLG